MVIIHVFNRYDEETIFFDEAVRKAKRKQLESNALDVRRYSYLVLAYDPLGLNFDKATLDWTVWNKSKPLLKHHANLNKYF